MKRIIQYIVCLLVSNSLFAADDGVTIIWESRHEAVDKFMRTENVIRTSDGGMLAIGTAGAGGIRRMMIKTDAHGKFEWKKIMGNDSAHVRGNILYNLPNGNIMFVGSFHHVYGIYSDPGYVYVLESEQNGLTSDSHYEYNAEGSLPGYPQMINRNDGTFTAIGGGFKNDKAAFLRNVGIDTKKIWEKIIPIAGLIDNKNTPRKLGLNYNSSDVTQDGDYFAFYNCSTDSNFFCGLFLKFSEEGDIQYAKLFEGKGKSELIRPKSAIATSDGGFALLYQSYILNSKEPTSKVVKLDADGKEQWAKVITKGKPMRADMNFLTETNDGNILVAGSTGEYGGETGSMAGTEQNLLVNLKANGEQLWEKQWGKPDEDERLEYILEEEDGFVLAGAVGKEYKRDLWLAKVQFTTTGIAEDEVLKNNFTISPNPAQSSASIRYTVSSASTVKIEVIDALGNIVAAPFTGFKTEGEYSLPFSTETLANGMYSVRLNINGKISTQNLSVVK